MVGMTTLNNIAYNATGGGGGGKETSFYPSKEDFPPVGESGILYIAEDNAMIYLYNTTTGSYDATSSPLGDIDSIDGGTAHGKN